MEWEVKKVTGGFRQLDENEGFSKSFWRMQAWYACFYFWAGLVLSGFYRYPHLNLTGLHGNELAILKFFMPRHLDGFQFALIRLFGIVLELRQFDNVAVQIGEADSQRINIGMLFG